MAGSEPWIDHPLGSPGSPGAAARCAGLGWLARSCGQGSQVLGGEGEGLQQLGKPMGISQLGRWARVPGCLSFPLLQGAVRASRSEESPRPLVLSPGAGEGNQGV